ncbi:MAG: hypothetical protein HYY13_07140 [Nitrospirae bacterium]|nr:hypothetical protein [Nitrospirota bacterium]
MTVRQALAGITLRPRATVRAFIEGGTFSYTAAWLLLIAYSAAAAATWVAAGRASDGNALRVLFIGEIVRPTILPTLSPRAQFAVLLAGKLACDLGLVFGSHRLAVRALGATRGDLGTWFKTYCFLLSVLDLYFVLATGVAALPDPTGTAMMISHVLLAFCLAWNTLVFTWAYAEVYGISDDRAYRGFFLSIILVPATVLLLIAWGRLL